MQLKTITVFFIICFSSGFSVAEPDVEYFRSNTFKEKKLPLSEAVRVGNLLFVSGNLGIDFSQKELSLVPGGLVPETKQAMRNIEKILLDSGSSLDRLVKCTLYMTDIEEWPELNAIWPSFFNENFPARTAVQVGKPWRGAAIEIDCIAHVD